MTALVTHPIQYQAPLFRHLSSDPALALEVLFLDDRSVGGHEDAGFGREFRWDVPLLEGYEHSFLVRGRRARASDAPALLARLRASRADALWVHGWGHPLLGLALLAGRRLARCVLVRGETRLGPGPGRAPAVLRAATHARLLRCADGALAIGRDNEAFLRARGVTPGRIFHVPYAVDAARFTDGAGTRDAVRAEFALDPEALVVLFVGKLRPHKAPLDLAAAVGALRTGGTRVEAWFVGDGPERAALEALPDDAGVRVLGFRNQTELPALYAAADVLCLPSRYEPWGLVANEAAHAACALVLSDAVGAATDLVVEGETGHVVPAADVDALGRTLAALAADRGGTRRLGERARARAAGYDFEADRLGLHAALGTLLR